MRIVTTICVTAAAVCCVTAAVGCLLFSYTNINRQYQSIGAWSLTLRQSEAVPVVTQALSTLAMEKVGEGRAGLGGARLGLV